MSWRKQGHHKSTCPVASTFLLSRKGWERSAQSKPFWAVLRPPVDEIISFLVLVKTDEQARNRVSSALVIGAIAVENVEILLQRVLDSLAAP